MMRLFPLLDAIGNLLVWSPHVLCERSINFIEYSCSQTRFLLMVEIFVMSCLVDLAFLKSARMCPFSVSRDD